MLIDYLHQRPFYFTSINSHSMTRIIDSVTSTNSFLLEELTNGQRPPEGELLFARFQSGGRGQRGNSWESNPNENILCSFVIYPDQINPADQFMITLAVSLGITDVLKEYVTDHHLMIKWPNDLYVGNKKLGGVLIENALMGSGIDYSVIGFGINVNQELFLSNAPNPISISQITGKKYDPLAIALEIREAIMKRFRSLPEEHMALKQEYYHRLYRYKKRADYQYEGRKIIATITGIDEYGRLRLLTSDGEELVAAFKEIEFLHK